MGRSIVLEWDSRRALVATGKTSKGARPALTRVAGFDLPTSGEGGAATTLSEALTKGLLEQKVGKGEATVIVERTSAEMRMLTVPPVPDNELPQVVRFQAGREFSNLSDGWLLDYVPLPPTANGQARVLAAAISPQVAVQIRGCCEAAGLELRRVMLRPFAVARLLKRAGRLFGNLLLIERLAESVEMTVFSESNVQLTRSVRISAEASSEALTAQIIGEVRRTLGSFRNQQAEGEVQRVLILADEPLTTALIPPLKEIVPGDVDAADPWELFAAGGTCQADSPADAYRYAGVLGGLDDPTPDPATEIDFINPSRPPAPPSNRTKIVIGVVAAVALLVSAFALYWMESSRLANQLKTLRAEVDEMRKQDQDYQARMAEVDLLEQWMVAKVDWSSELSHISRRLPLPDDAIVNNMVLTADQTAGQANIAIKGRVSTPEMIGRIEEELRDTDEGREISGRKITPSDTAPYNWIFDETIKIDLLQLREVREAEWDATFVETAAAEADTDADVETDTDSEVVTDGTTQSPSDLDGETTNDGAAADDGATDEDADEANEESTTEDDSTEETTTEEDAADDANDSDAAATPDADDEHESADADESLEGETDADGTDGDGTEADPPGSQGEQEGDGNEEEAR